ncbi:protein SIEVE ELEMENT OCCLUSION B-like isoform X1 [Ipomoea triloba]|uniref:protein SIEVE ELEMENT OCCLUSION B-like isoform X1 n=1 Tax=Ipomoea triloba TaxID=35885 RepID=UPI00125E49E7|nr:protein SIEVE ELEMENT OCCLUSION B-like isoform X1 [Ipomoea triloba]
MGNVKEQVTNSSEIFTMEETAILKKIKATYDLDNLEFNMLPILELIEDIIYTPNVSSDSAEERPKFQYEVIGKMHQNFASKINVISSEILGSCNRNQDTNEIVLSMFGALSTLKWIAKGVVALAAFAINYGEFRLLVEQHSSDSTAKLLSLLENVPADFFEEDLYINIAKLAKAAMDLIKYLWRVKYLYVNHISSKTPIEDLDAKLHIAIYWIIQSIVICQSIITNLASTGYESISSTAEQWELYYLTEKVTELHQQIEKETSEKLWRLFPQKNITILTDVICCEDHMPVPLIDGDTKIPQKVDMLKNKPVLLYISNLDPLDDEIETVKRVHAARKDEFQFVWLPVFDKSEDWNEQTYETKRKLMPWLVVRKPQLLDGTIVKFIENGWEFKKRSIIVAFDRYGNIVNKNALPMILIWGSKGAYPFTDDKETELWKSQTWSLKLLLPLPEFTSETKDHEKITQLDQWIKDEKNYICMYGGKDIEWIKRFEARVGAIANDLSIPPDNMKMLNLDSLSVAWITWARIEAIFVSRSKQVNEQSDDPIKEGALTMCSFHWSRRGWAIISECSSNSMAKALGNVMLNCLNKCKPEEWKKNGLVKSLNACISKSCETLHFLPTFPEIPKMRVCSQSICGRPMRKSVTFHCLGDKKTQSTTDPTAKT